MVVLIIVQLFIIGLFLLFGYLIIKKEYYSLISGFESKSEEDKKILIENGYPQAMGRVMIYSSIILFIGLILFLFGIPYMIEISLLVMVVYLFAAMFYYSKLDTTTSRKRNRMMLIFTIVFTVIIIAGSTYVGFQENDVTITADEVQISGMYGVDWKLAELTNVELVEILPDIQVRTNGFAFANRLKGKFRLDELGNGRLFIYTNHSPFLYIEKGEDFLFINAKDPEKTKQWYDQLTNK